MKRSLIFGLIAVLSAGLLLVACSDGSDSGGGPSSYGGWLLDREIIGGNEGEFLAALDNPLYKVIGVTTTKLTLTTNRVIPADKTVVLFAELDTATFVLEAQGTLVVEGSGVLTAKGGGKVRITDGYVEVTNGKIDVDSVVSIYLRDIQNQAFGTSQVRFNGGTLNLDTTLASLDDIKTAFKWVPKGTVIIDAVTEKIKPSDLAKIETTAVRRLTITDPVGFVTPGDLVEELTIPAGLTFETADPLPSLKSLTVLGDLTDDAATLANVEALTVAGEGVLEAEKATYAKLTELTVSSAFTAPTALGALTALTVEAGGAFTTTSSVGGAEGITLAVANGGAASIAHINGLKASVIEGALTSATGYGAFDTGTSAVTPLSAVAGAVINGITFTGETTNITALSVTEAPLSSVTTENFVVPASKALTIAENTALIIAPTFTFTYDGQVIIEADGSLVLETGTTSAKIAGTGAITVGGNTVFNGAWEGVGAANGTLSITGSANGAVILADTDANATGLKASAAGATIIQNAVQNNVLAIGAADHAVKLDLAGTTNGKVGELILRGGAQPGKLSIPDTGSFISIGAGGTATKLAGLTGFAIGGVSAVNTTFTKDDYCIDATSFLTQIGATTAAGTITAVAAAGGDDVVINSTIKAAGEA
jgi:hypothetical protein